MTIFGRDSLITSYQSLPFTPDLARTALRVLAARQGTKMDDFRDEEPGKILHEIRFGELIRFGERPHSPYFGAADTTPFFLVLLDEYERWSGDVELVRSLEPNARAALGGSTNTATATATVTSSTSAATRRPVSRTSAGRTRGTRSSGTTGRSPSSRGRPARSRATSTTASCARRASRRRSGATPRWRIVWSAKPRSSGAASTRTSG
jgi:hypothetical protein